MSVIVTQENDRVEVQGASVEDVREGLRLVEAARELQLRRTREAKLRILNVMAVADIDIVPPDSLDQARRLGMLHAALLSTPVYTYETLAEVRRDKKVSTTRTWVSRQKSAHRIFIVSDQGRAFIPAFQLSSDGSPREELAPLIETLAGAGVGDFATWVWLTSPSPLLSGAIPSEVALSNPPRALQAATRFVARR